MHASQILYIYHYYEMYTTLKASTHINLWFRNIFLVIYQTSYSNNNI